MDTLRDERKRRGWSTAYVAVQLNASTSTVDRWEAGQSVPSARHLVGLARLYGVSADTILDALERQRVHSEDG